MSVKIISQVWEQSQQDGSALLMLHAIADFAHDDGMVWVGGITVKTLAAKARLKERQAQNVIRLLDGAGEIYAPAVAGRGHSTRYFVTIGFSQEHITECLTRNCQMTRVEAEATATAIIGKQAAYAAAKKVHKITPFTQKVQRTAPIKKEKVQSSVIKGAIQRTRKPRSSASHSAAPDPIRNDPYISLSKDKESDRADRAPHTPKEKKPPTPIAIIQAMADVCVIDRAIAAKRDHIILADAAGALYQAGKRQGQTDEQIIGAIRGFGKWFKTGDFRGQKGEAPTPDLVRRLWKQYHEAGQKKHASSAPPVATKPDLPADPISFADLAAAAREQRNRNAAS